MNKQKRIDELIEFDVLYRYENKYNMTGHFREKLAVNIVKMKQVDEAIVVTLLHFFGELGKETLVDYLQITENFVNKESLREMIG